MLGQMGGITDTSLLTPHFHSIPTLAPFRKHDTHDAYQADPLATCFGIAASLPEAFPPSPSSSPSLFLLLFSFIVFVLDTQDLTLHLLEMVST